MGELRDVCVDVQSAVSVACAIAVGEMLESTST